MAQVSNKKLGNDFEREFCEILSKKGYWVHNFANRAAGQPMDVIAVKYGAAYLIDCKVCLNNRFTLSRVEDNQRRSNSRWFECGNGVGWIAVKVNNAILMLSMVYLDMVYATEGKKSLNLNALLENGLLLDEWLEHNEKRKVVSV